MKLHDGKNCLVLLSATIGLKNHGALFELMPAGIAGGLVKLVDANGTVIYLSHSSWSYKLKRGCPIGLLNAHNNAIFDVCYIKEGSQILTASGDQTLKISVRTHSECEVAVMPFFKSWLVSSSQKNLG